MRRRARKADDRLDVGRGDELCENVRAERAGSAGENLSKEARRQSARVVLPFSTHHNMPVRWLFWRCCGLDKASAELFHHGQHLCFMAVRVQPSAFDVRGQSVVVSAGSLKPCNRVLLHGRILVDDCGVPIRRCLARYKPITHCSAPASSRPARATAAAYCGCASPAASRRRTQTGPRRASAARP